MNRLAPLWTRALLTLTCLAAYGAEASAQEGWRGAITNVSITSRANMELFLERVEERKDDGYHCIDVELDGSTVWGVFVQCPAITDSEVWPYHVGFHASMRGSDWHQIDAELIGHTADGAWYVTTHIQTTAIDGDGHFSRSSKTDFKDRIGESEDSGYTVTDFGYMDGQWRALTSKESGVFSGRGVFEGRTSFADVVTRCSDLNAAGKRIVDIEHVGGRWYYYARKSDDLGASGAFSRSSFSDFSARVNELEDEGRFLVDLEIVDGKFYGLTVDNG